MKRGIRIPLVTAMLLICAPACGSFPAANTPSVNPAPATLAVSPAPGSPTPQATASPVGAVYAWNYLAQTESGGVLIQIGRLILAEKTAIPYVDFSVDPTFNDKPVVAALIFVVQNTTSQSLNVYPDQGTVVAGTEQVELADYSSTFGDPVGGEILPGVKKIGGLWFGFRSTSVDAIQRMTVLIQAPSDSNNNKTGTDYTFDLDLSQRRLEAPPAELK